MEHTPPPPPPDAPNPAPGAGNTSGLSSDDRTMAMLIHLLAIFTGFLGPLILWLIKKDSSNFVNAHGRAALNFVFTIIIAQLIVLIVGVGAFAAIIAIGGEEGGAFAFIPFCLFYIALFAFGIFALVQEIMHCLQANRGEFKPYPMSIRFFKPVDPYA